MTKELLARGERVLGACRNPAKAEELVALAAQYDGRLTVFPLDVTSDDSLGALCGLLRSSGNEIDVLINNAGMASANAQKFGSLQREALQECYAVNSVAPLIVTQALTPMMPKGAKSLVVNISSILGSIGNITGKSDWFNFGYNSSKAGLNMTSKMLAEELRPMGIGVLNLHPGWVRTDLGGADATLSPQESAQALIALMDSFEMSQTGAYKDPSGNVLPW